MGLGAASDKYLLKKCLELGCPPNGADEGLLVEVILENSSCLNSFADKSLENKMQLLELLPSELWKHTQLALAAVNLDGNGLQFAPEVVRDDEGIVAAAVMNCGAALEHASKRLRDDEGIVAVAVTNDGAALEFASKRLRDMESIAGAAVTNCEEALAHASKRLRNTDFKAIKSFHRVDTLLEEALQNAAEKGETEEVKALLERGADIHAGYEAALLGAAAEGHTDTVRLLLDKGADLWEVGAHTVNLAAENGHTETVKLLLSRYEQRGFKELLQDYKHNDLLESLVKEEIKIRSPKAVKKPDKKKARK